MPPLLADFIHARGCKPICEKSLTLPVNHFLVEVSASGKHDMNDIGQ